MLKTALHDNAFLKTARQGWNTIREVCTGYAGSVKVFFRKKLREWLRQLHSVSGDLGTLITTTEDEFLIIGDKLHQYYKQSGQLSTMASDIAQQMAGDTIEKAIIEFKDIFQRIKLQEQESEQSIEDLRAVLSMISDIQGPLDSFEQTVKTLNVLAVCTRIENAHLNSIDTGFDTLADSIRKLAIEIKAKSDEISNQIGSLCPMIQQAIAKIEGLKSVQNSRVQVILDKTAANLNTLKEKNRLSAESVLHMSDKYNEIYKGIGEIVSSMQFHDITRQKYEHVQEAVEDVSRVFRGRSIQKSPGASGQYCRSMGEAVDVIRLQSAQLQHATDGMVSAVEGIIANLMDIRRAIAAMCLKTEELTGAGDASDHSFLSDLQKDIVSISSALEEYGNARNEVSHAMDSVAETVRNVSKYIKDIQLIGMQIERIALNAQIRAAHIGIEGAALGELAEAIQGLSSETKKITSDVSKNFSAIASAAEELHQESDVEEVGKSAADHMISELRSLMNTIHALNSRMEELVAQLGRDSQELEQDIEHTAAGTNVHKRVAEVVDQARDVLDGIVESSGTLSTRREKRVATSEDLKMLEERYTMNSERQVHQDVLWGDSDQLPDENIPPASEADKQGEDKELGDNVELF